MDENLIKEQQNKLDAQRDFDRALLNSFFSAIISKLKKHPSTLMSLEEIKKRFHLKKETYKGIENVKISDIVGSEGRYSDFDKFFNPKTSNTRQKWLNIDTAIRNNISLPPVQLYKVDNTYFVRDGHHRISVAKAMGQKYIEAEITEIDVPFKFTKSTNLKSLLIKQEYSIFLELTELDKIISKEDEIELTELGGYDIILEHIKMHKFFIEKEKGEKITYQQAAESWYKNLYLPFIEIIKKNNIHKFFKKRTPADIYVWILNHKKFILKEFGSPLDINKAVESFIEKYDNANKKEIKNLVKNIKQSKPFPKTNEKK